MPMFQVDGGRPVVARPVRPADAAYGATVVDEHLGALLGEHLLPVRMRDGAADEPYLLAVDVHAAPVVVEVVGLLDGPTLLRALAHLGRASRLSMRDLAAAYHGGSGRFTADLATFRESVPAVRLVPNGGPARLLVVCAVVGEGMTDVVEALGDRGIDVLRVGVVDGPDGRLVDVSPVRLSAPDGSWSVSGGVATLAERPPLPEESAADGQLRAPRVPPHGPVPTPTALGPSVVTRISTGVAESSLPPKPRVVARADEDGPDAYQQALAALTAPSRPVAAEATATDSVPTWSPVRPFVEEVAAPQPPAVRRLASLATGGPVVLVWHRHRRGTYHEALVHPHGEIELSDGTRVADPSAAAEIAISSSVPVDGWRVWRVGGADGPMLGEAC